MVKKKDERIYDHQIMDFLESRGYVCGYRGSNSYFKRKLKGGYARRRAGLGFEIDVFGVKDIGDQFTENIEIVGVEVKLDNFLNGLRQASHYISYHHKAHVAMPREFSPNEINDAEECGIGLLEISESEGKIEEILAPKKHYPPKEKVERFLHDTCGIWKCSYCRLHYFYDDNFFIPGLGATSGYENFSNKGKEIKICRKCIETIELGGKWWGEVD